MKQSRVFISEQKQRSGLAAVEFSLTLPLLILLVLGSVEASNAIFLRQAMTIAAYETAQVASAYGGTESEAKQRGADILAGYNLREFSIDITPAITSEMTAGTKIEVAITAPSNSNSIGPPWFFKDATYERKFVMYRL